MTEDINWYPEGEEPQVPRPCNNPECSCTTDVHKPLEQVLYTPTTEEVRAGYSTATYDDAKAEAEFDRWLIAERKRVAEMAIKKERKRAMTIIMTNIGEIVWQVKHNPETDAIDMSKMYKAIMGEDDV